MQAALFANTAWLDEELSTFRQLAVGLLDEQVQIVAVVPHHLPEQEPGAFVKRVTWTEARWPIINRRRLVRLADRLGEMNIQLLHALDGRVWTAVLRLSEVMDLPAVLSASAWFDVELGERLGAKIRDRRAIVTAATRPLADALCEKLPPEVEVELVRPGVHRGATDENERLKTEAMCAIISGNGRLDGRYESLLRGLVDVIRQRPDTQLFFDGQGADQHAIWRCARKLGLLANVSLVPRRLGHREMLLRSDALVHPQPLGRARGLTLRAMAHGVPVIAHEDPWLDYLDDGHTAWVVRDPDPATWTARFRRLMEDPESARDLAHAEREWVVANRPTSTQIERTLDIYRRLTGEGIKFPG